MAAAEFAGDRCCAVYKGPTPSTRSPDSLVDFHTGAACAFGAERPRDLGRLASMVRTTHMTHGCATDVGLILGRALGPVAAKEEAAALPSQRRISWVSTDASPWASLAVRPSEQLLVQEADIPNARALFVPAGIRLPRAVSPRSASSTRASTRRRSRPVSIAPGSSSATTPPWPVKLRRTHTHAPSAYTRAIEDRSSERAASAWGSASAAEKPRATSAATCSGAVFGTGIFFHVSGAAAISFLFARPWPGRSHSSPAWHSTFRD